MKQSTVRTLGVAVLGTAFAAVGSAAAQALPLSDVGSVLGTVNTALPAGQHALANTVEAAQPTLNAAVPQVEKAAPQVLGADGKGAGGLLGGLPVNGVNPASALGALGG
ncbi:ATP-binding protein [Streptomyces sp. NPDC050560]|uniref:ATP-binding protein n=1 Tax=Streptomyces sp. NPDC050560 TaxID=3365630 RepID=UPI0037B8419E